MHPKPTKLFQVEHLAASNCLLGEGPVWRKSSQSLLFLDIIGKQLLSWHANEGLDVTPLKQRVGSAVSTNNKTLLAASERGLFELTPQTGALKSIGHDLVIGHDNLMNDGKCDRQGRFIFGSKALNETDKTGALMSFDGKSIKIWQSGTVINGPAFSPDGTRLYFADSAARTIFTAAYETETGTIGKAEIFSVLTDDAGYPDGMSVDEEGALWNAHWDGWRLSRYLPNGKLDMEIAMPVSRPTSIAFGGENMKTLFVTSAKTGRADDPLLTEAQAGDLFSLRTEVAGLAEPEFDWNGHA